jgi:predicted DNA binding CopG/RHH family protein
MKIETIKKRLTKDRPMVSVTLRMPEDIVNDLKKIAPTKGFSGYQALMRSYVGVGIREDLELCDCQAN